MTQMAADLAPQLVEAGDIAHGRRDAYGFFTSDMQINFASLQVIVLSLNAWTRDSGALAAEWHCLRMRHMPDAA